MLRQFQGVSGDILLGRLHIEHIGPGVSSARVAAHRPSFVEHGHGGLDASIEATELGGKAPFDGTRPNTVNSESRYAAFVFVDVPEVGLAALEGRVGPGRPDTVVVQVVCRKAI